MFKINKIEETIPSHEDVLSSLKTTSDKIRYLDSQRFTPTQICTKFGLITKKGAPIRYQHVRNVLSKPLKRKVK